MPDVTSERQRAMGESVCSLLPGSEARHKHSPLWQSRHKIVQSIGESLGPWPSSVDDHRSVASILSSVSSTCYQNALCLSQDLIKGVLTKRSPSVALQFPSLSASITFVHVCERFLQLKSSSKLEPVVLHSWANSVLPFSPRFACLPQQYNFPVLRSRAPSAQVREEVIPPIRETAVVAVAY